MALGGGTFLTQNKTLPGTYINFVSVASASAAISDRGVVTMPLELDWGVEDEVFTVSNEAFLKDSQRIFGYPYTDDRLKGLRDLFLNAKTLYAYRLNGGGKKASNSYATAKYSGVRGNDLKISIQANVDEESAFDVLTYLGEAKVDAQTVRQPGELKENGYVTFQKDMALEAALAVPLTGGENGTVDGASYQAYADKIESYTYNAMGIVTTDDKIKKMFAAFNRRLRDEIGIKFQLVAYDYKEADYMGVISVKNRAVDGERKTGEGMEWPNEAAAVYWVTGAEGGCAVNATCQNRVYDGEYTLHADYTQAELTAAIKSGEFVFHKVNSDIRVLSDINTMVTTTDGMGDVFKDNQTIRVIDQLGNDDAALFNTKYLGKVPNDDAGRTALWSDFVKIRRELERMRAIENFNEADVKVSMGDTKKAVVVESAVTVVNAMSQLYITTTIA